MMKFSPFFRQDNLTCQSEEKTNAQMFFEHTDLTAYRAVCDVKLCCRQRHAGEAACCFESTQGLQWGEPVKYHMCENNSRMV